MKKSANRTKNFKNIFRILIPMVLLFLAGCNEMTVSNLTPQKVPENPSGIYTITFKPNLQDANIIKETVQIALVIDGKEHKMGPTSLNRKIYEYNYKMPEGQTSAKYYCVTKYDVAAQESTKHREVESEIFELELVNRYVISLESSRGPAGARIALMGRGLSRKDKVYFNDEPAITKFVSGNTLVFTIPQVPANKSYTLFIDNDQNAINAGEFMVDKAHLTIVPETINMESEESSTVVIKIDHKAPRGGILINATTDIPNSLIMPEIIIPEGSRTVSIPIEGYKPGRGKLYFDAPGYVETSVAVTVASSGV